ncbi:uncharacterized protein LOC133303189 [Gastrolobium bilobum]|uniref:uncharacterized protein LOC133303189 n=1 Tax=Gastrolobium bilobum TaxID=150636 RepID=UPI002AB1182E|nr:uncharacterized protein LOC133303189 [Gastrolobium bilobum]
MTKQRKESKFIRYMKTPFRFLIKVRDMYVQGMIKCSNHLSYVDATMVCPTAQFYAIPRSFSVNSARSSASDVDFKELMRVSSLRSHGHRAELGEAAVKVSRCRSVGIGTIDEEEPCDHFGDDIKVKPHVYPRSKSYAIGRGGTGLF